jgi:hypothetical protein
MKIFEKFLKVQNFMAKSIVRLNFEKWTYSRITPKTVFSGNSGPWNSMVMFVWR